MSGAAPTPRPKGGSALATALGGLAALAVAMGVGRFVFTPILPAMQEGFGLTGGEAGLVAAANFVGYLLGALAVSLAPLPGSRKGWLVGSLAVSAATTGAMGLAASVPAFAVLRFLGGGASALAFVLASALVLEALGAAGRTGLSALHFSGVGIGIALSGIVVPGLEGAGIGWRGLWLGCGLVSLVGPLAAALMVPGAVRAPAPATAVVGGAQPAGYRLGPLILSYGLFGFGYVITATFLVAIARSEASSSAIEPLLWLCVGLAAAPSVLLWRIAAARLGLMRAYALACAVEALGVAASVLEPSGAGLVAAAVLLGGTFMGITALGLDGARAGAGGDSRRPVGLMTASFGLGQTIGPLVAGLMHDRWGSFRAPSLVAAACLIAAGLIVLAEGRRTRAGAL